MNDLTFEQAALLSRWLSGDREGISASEPYIRADTEELGHWIWIRGPVYRSREVWVPADLEYEHSGT